MMFKLVVVVSAETGCGKTTQLPQFILESEIEAGRGDRCNIICTQPRQNFARSVAQRVAEERAELIGQTVGYQIHLDYERSGRTKLFFAHQMWTIDFCTEHTGVIACGEFIAEHPTTAKFMQSANREMC